MVVGSFAHKGGQYSHYGLMLLRSLVIIRDATQQICDAQLTVISLMGQRACDPSFYIQSRPITSLWIDVTMQPVDCQKDQTKIIDALLTLTLQGQSFWLKVIPSLLTVNIQFLDNIVFIQQHRGLSVSEPPLFMSSVG